MIQFTKAAEHIHNPVRSHPVVTDEDRTMAAADPQYPVRLHCKHWTDAQSVGWTLFYGYLASITVTGLEAMTLSPMTDENLDALLQRRHQYIEESGKHHGRTIQMGGVIKLSYKKWSAEHRRRPPMTNNLNVTVTSNTTIFLINLINLPAG